MASQVFSGNGNFTYTNNTGGNVRVVINLCSASGNSSTTGSQIITISFGSVSFATNLQVFGRNLAFYFQGGGSTAAGTGGGSGTQTNFAANNAGVLGNVAPTELMLKSGEVFSLSAFSNAQGRNTPLGVYNIVVIPEAG